jgi:hypothetical protein
MAVFKSQSVLSTEPYRVAVSATVAGNPLNLSTDTVQFAFMAAGDPGNADWRTGTWETTTVSGKALYVAQCLVGPANSGVSLSVGPWNVWVKVVDNPDVPVRQVGTLQIT